MANNFKVMEQSVSSDIKFFTHVLCTENIELPEHLPDIEQIISSLSAPEIISIKAISTPIGLSCEGQCLSGKKVVVELKIKYKILYAASGDTKTVHIFESNTFQNVYIVIPKLIEGTEPETLFKNKYLKVTVNIDTTNTHQTNKRNLLKSTSLSVNIHHTPTYELCCSYYQSPASSDIFVLHEDGTHSKYIPSFKNSINKKPKWSPSGHEIAFISNNNGYNSLYVFSINTSSIKRVSNSDYFKDIGSFCWLPDGTRLLFSGYVGKGKEIFSINVRTLEFKQLTRGDEIIRSHKPKCSPDGKKIAFLRSCRGVTDLWLMDMKGQNCIRLTACGSIKYFDWLVNSNVITFILNKDGKADELQAIRLENQEISILAYDDSVPEIRNIKCSPDSKYVAYIGSTFATEDIYIYDLDNKKVVNLTKNPYSTKISDFVWKIDSSKIYYSANELFNYNIYSVSLNTGLCCQLTNLNNSRIELDYRPRIG